MSIIYDALKKLEKSNNRDLGAEVDKSQKHSKFKPKIYLFYLLMVCLGIFIGNIFFSFLSRPEIAKVEQTKPYQELPKEASPEPKEATSLETEQPVSTVTKKDLKESLVLNGVFFSQNEGYALINNQIVKEGSVIEGATVKRITLDEVELESDGSIFKLSTNK